MDNEAAITRSYEGRSNRVAAFDEQGIVSPVGSLPNSTGQLSDDKNFDDQETPGWRKFMRFIGPGFLVSMAYIDPGSLATNLQAGASYSYELLWIILLGFIFVLIIQSLAANLGVTTGKHLAELCKAEYPRSVKCCLWLLAEFAVINADIPEVIGTAFALNILAHIPVWLGVLLTGLSTLLLLGLQRYGIRKLELLITVLVFVLAACFFGEMGYVKPPASQVLKGLFVPKLSGSGSVGASIAVLGALIMPHNLFLHSALVLSRKVPRSRRGINDACKFFLQESAFALFVALLINIAMISVAGAVCTAPDITNSNANICNNLTLDSASFLLKNVLGRSSSTVYAIALLASGQSSSITGTYAGQFIMQGFINLKLKGWKRNLMTRSIAIVPSLIVSVIGGSNGAGRLIISSSMVLLFELPFALLPLLKFSSSPTKMGPHKNSIYIIMISWLGSLGIIGINIYYLSTGFVHWLLHNSLPMVGKVFMGILVFPLMVVYMLALIYLTLRKDTVVTFEEPVKHQSDQEVNMENGVAMTSGPLVEVPFREDLADIPLPE
ncbi:hypothetical protein MLD38_013047 [Melastoma candidum]|uniref:Uncharacterized protein n=1 Tax=Melastoma candidum TaxID=119954 RepID=A0ACB9RBE8_9MYRT|nr:hypothetical protein MLD38_013047 [Melastoma candidum]